MLNKMNEFIKTIEGSELWESLNIKVNTIVQDYSKELSDEEYQAIRNMLVCKVMIEDSEVKEAFTKFMYNELRNN